MENVITEVSKYLIILLMMIYTFSCFTVFRKRDIEDQRNVLRRQIVLMLFMNLVAYTVLFLQNNDMKILMMYGAVFLFIVVVQILYRVIYRKGNLLIVNNMCMLLSIGFLILSRLSFDKAVKQFEIVEIGMVLSFIVPVIVRKVKILKDLTWLYGIVGLALLMVVLAMAAISGGAKLSIEIGGVTFQFSELVKITFVFFVAGMLREDTSFKRVVVTTIVAAAHVLILVVSKDLGSAVVFFVAYIVMLYVATKKARYALAGLAGGAVAAVAAYFLFNHVRQRVIVWQDPIAVYDKVGGGYQVAQGLFGISAGGWFGMGLGKGMPDIIPVVDKDFIFAAICEEYAFQVFLTVGGTSKFIPMTGITLPLVSYGGSSVICTILMFAIIQGLYILREDEGEELERKRKEKRKKSKKPPKQNPPGGNGVSGGSGYREKTLEEKIQEQTEKSLNW